jgi:hypothetical protein
MADESVSMDKTQPCGKHSLLSSISSWFDFELCSNCSEEVEFDVWSDPFVCVGPDAVFNACRTVKAADSADPKNSSRTGLSVEPTHGSRDIAPGLWRAIFSDGILLRRSSISSTANPRYLIIQPGSKR